MLINGYFKDDEKIMDLTSDKSKIVCIVVGWDVENGDAEF